VLPLQSKLGQKAVHRQVREILNNLYIFMKAKAMDRPQIHFKKTTERAAGVILKDASSIGIGENLGFEAPRREHTLV
jgi:hypothetical protein